MLKFYKFNFTLNKLKKRDFIPFGEMSIQSESNIGDIINASLNSNYQVKSGAPHYREFQHRAYSHQHQDRKQDMEFPG